MNLPEIAYGFNKPRDLLEKLRRDYKILDVEATPDAIFNFTITAFHLLEDWIRQQPKNAINNKAKKKISEKLSTKSSDNAIKICRDIANGSKHFKFDAKYASKKIVTDVTVYTAGFGNSRCGKVPFGGTEQMVKINTEEKSYCIHDLKKEVMEFCEDLFETYDIP